MKDVTIQDIARVAGVSKSTVSRVLNGAAVVRPEKRQAVLDAVGRLKFQPNVVARSLANGRSMTIGVLTQLIGSPFYDTISQGVVAGLNDTGYSPIFVDGQWRKKEEVAAIQALLGRRVDGLILIGGDVPGDEIAALCDGLPTVVVARRLNQNQHHCVYMDNVDGGRQATQHLIDNGHRRIAMIQGLPHHADAVDRFAGYQQALQKANIPIDRNLILDGDFSAESGVAAVEQLLSRSAPFTAIFAANDIMAFGARLALHRRGVRAPEDVSLVGFDDQMEAAFVTPPLTTIRQPAREMGERVARDVLAMIHGESLASTSFRGQLIIRESVESVV